MSTAARSNVTISYVEELAKRLGANWPSLVAARLHAQKYLLVLREELRGETSPDVSIVVHGSLARLEFTSESDLDWTFLIDGQANPQHQDDLLRIRRKLEHVDLKPPGPEGTFGTLTFSHEIIHMIGGEEDSNANTTKRILLLLEAAAVGDYDQALLAVRKNILDRYLREDYGLGKSAGSNDPRWIPLFLLNDMARYWRTMAVDFAYKQRRRGIDGYALRSLKLGISRKLIYASGLLSCFWCDPQISTTAPSEEFKRQKCIAALNEMISLTPLERMAKFYLFHLGLESMQSAARLFFDSYESFVTLLSLPEKRNTLKQLTVDQMYGDECFLAAREIRLRFKDAIRQTFLQPTSPLYKPIIEFGVF
jgi:predicted nucleotidyltransferase